MHRSLVLAVVTGACALALAGAMAPAGAGASQDEQMKQAILVLRGYIDRTGSYDFWVFPKPAAVRLGGHLDAPVWPRDPWTGGPLSRGTGLGHFTYRVASDRRSYRLTGYLSWGPYVVSGGMPGSIRLAYNHRAREGAALLQRYIELWALTHEGVYPPGDEIRRHGAVGRQPGMAYWPSNPWNHDSMRRGRRRGCFDYTRADDGRGYALVMHLDWGKTMVLSETAATRTTSASVVGSGSPGGSGPPGASPAAGSDPVGLLAGSLRALRGL